MIRDDVLKDNSDGRIKVFVVWEAILPKDSADAVDDAVDLMKDEWRAIQFWDPVAESGKRVRRLMNLEIPNPAWDIYLLYARGTKWEQPSPPTPAFWMHQLNGERRHADLRLDTTRLREEVQKLLAK